MNIIEEIVFGIGYYDPVSNGIKELKDISIFLHPFERKVYSFYLYGTDVTENSLLSVIASIETLLPTTTVRTSFSKKGDTTYWTNTDTLYTTTETVYKFYVELHNNYYTELNSVLRLDAALYKNETISELSYYGNVSEDGTLTREIEVKSNRTLVIDPTPEGADYTYLSYSHGDTLIFLDDDSAIPYKPEPLVTLEANRSIAMPDAGFLLWDDSELVDWDTDQIDETTTEE